MSSETTAAASGDIPADTFANRLMLSRAHAGHLSIREAADLCSLGRGAWTNWEQGARPQDLVEVCQVISEKLHINFNWLLLGGPLRSSSGRPTRRVGSVTGQYRTVAEWAIAGGPSNRPGTGAIHPTGRRPRLIEVDHLAAA